jgi:N-formylglutamate amidohydrolase
MSTIADQFLLNYPQFNQLGSSDTDRINQIESAYNRAIQYISVNLYCSYYTEAVFLKTASFLFKNIYLSRTQNGIVIERTVVGEYTVKYNPDSAVSRATGKTTLFNPYEDELEELSNRIGVGLGLFL